MRLADRLKKLTKKAEDTAAEHKDQIHHGIQKAEAAADQKTGGKYHDQIQKAGAKTDAFVDDLKPAESHDTSKTGSDPAGPSTG